MDLKLLYWSGARVNLGVILVCVGVGVRRVRGGDVAGHRRMMLTSAALVGLFFAKAMEGRGIPFSGHLGPSFSRKILNVGPATPAVLLPQIDPI